MTTLTSKLIVALVDQVTAPSRAIASSIKRLTDAQARNTARLDATRRQMLDAVAVGYALAKSVAAPVKAAMDLESAMADVAKVTNFDDAGLKGFERSLRDLAVSEIPLAVTELTALAAAAAQSGVPEAELLDFTRTTAKAAVAWEVSGASAGESLAKLRSALGLTNKEVGLYADVINHLSDNTASSAPDLVDFARRVAAQGEFFGIARDQSLAFGAAMIGAGAQSEVASTSFRNMGRALTRGASATKRQAAAYGKLGLNAVTVAKNMQKDAVPTILDVMERLSKLPDYVQASVMTDLFGDEARALAPLLGRMDILREALGHVADQTVYAGSVNAEFAKRAETTEYALQRFRSRINELGIVIGQALLPALNDLLEAFGPMINRLAELAGRYPALTRAVIAAVAGFVALRIAAVALQFAFLWMKGGVIAAAIGGLRGLQIAGRGLALAFWPVTAGLRAVRTAMIGYAASAAVAGHGTALAIMARSLLGLLNPMRLVTVAFRVLKVALIGTGIGAVLVGIAAAGTWIYNNWSGISTMFEAFKGAFSRAIEPIMPALQPVIDGFGWLWDSVMGLLGPIDELGGGWAQAGIAAGKFAGDTLVAIVGLPGEMAKYLGQVVDRIVALASDMVAAGKALMAALLEGIKAGAQAVLDYVSDMGKRITGAVSGAASGAWNRMKNAVGFGDSPAIEGARASGGPVKAGLPYLVGEKGPEIVTFARDAFVHSAAASARMARTAALASTMAAPTAAGVAASPAPPTIHVGGITIEVNAAPGQSAEQIAESVERILSARLTALYNGAFNDGVN